MCFNLLNYMFDRLYTSFSGEVKLKDFKVIESSLNNLQFLAQN